MTLQSSEPDLVSVVIPTYQGDRFIETALRDIVAQTWQAWEVIVVEDGSKGQTESIVRRVAADHPSHRIEYLRHERNMSQSAARNTGIQAAHGKYIALLDVDDRWQPSHLTASMATLREKQADLAYSTVVTFDDRSGIPIGIWGPQARELKRFPFSLLERCFIAPSGVVFSRNVAEEVGPFNPSLAPCEDMDFWLRCAAHEVKFAHVQGCHVLYRKNHAEAQTRGTCRLTETYARTLDCHRDTWRKLPFKLNKRIAQVYFGAAWCHATTNPAQDPTADPSHVPALILRACELHRGHFQYQVHRALFKACEKMQSDFARSQLFRWFKPRKFIRMGNLTAA